MAIGFELLAQNRVLQVHWAKRVVAFLLDLVVVMTPLWLVLYLFGEIRPEIYGIAGGVAFYAYAVVTEAIWRGGIGKLIAGLEVRSVGGPVTIGKVAVRSLPKLFWFAFPLLDTILGLLTEGDPRQRFSDRLLGTTVAQSSLVHVRVHKPTPHPRS